MNLGAERELPSLERASGWINSESLTAAGLRGRVVLVDFWTYSCINWLRTLPYVRSWAGKYGPDRLTVVGVHTPEFRFEHDVDNVRRAVREMGIDYPVALDPDYAIWRGFANHYWPALYFVDAAGQLRDHRFGEGDYEGSERLIQRLLREAGTGAVGPDLVSVDAVGIEAAADWASLKSPETYLGYDRTENFASTDRLAPDDRRTYASPSELNLNRWSLSGDWTAGSESAVGHAAGGRLAVRFHARDLHLVMGPAATGASVRFRVLLDGDPPGESHGLDAGEDGTGIVSWPRLFQLVRQRGPVREHTFEIEFLDPGIAVYVFTFG